MTGRSVRRAGGASPVMHSGHPRRPPCRFRPPGFRARVRGVSRGHERPGEARARPCSRTPRAVGGAARDPGECGGGPSPDHPGMSGMGPDRYRVGRHDGRVRTRRECCQAWRGVLGCPAHPGRSRIDDRGGRQFTLAPGAPGARSAASGRTGTPAGGPAQRRVGVPADHGREDRMGAVATVIGSHSSVRPTTSSTCWANEGEEHR